MLAADWGSDVVPDKVVVAILSTNGMVVVDWTSDVTAEIVVSPSIFEVLVVDGISDVITEEVVVKDPSPIEVLVMANIIAEVVGSTVLVTFSTVSSVVTGSVVTTFDISVVTWIATVGVANGFDVEIGPVYLINILIFLLQQTKSSY